MSALDAARTRLGRIVARSVGMALPWIIRRSLRQGLRGVWRIGAEPVVPAGPVVLAPNHHSWWDVYLAWCVAERIGRPRTALMERAQLERFPFFREIGVLAHDEVREALARLRAGDVLIVFPEGRLRAAGSTGPLQRGTSFFSRHAGAPVVPVAMRVVLRGAKKPEAYVSFGTAIEPGEDVLDQLSDQLDRLLASIDDTLSATHPEEVPDGAERWLGGTRSTRDRPAWWERLWLG